MTAVNKTNSVALLSGSICFSTTSEGSLNKTIIIHTRAIVSYIGSPGTDTRASVGHCSPGTDKWCSQPTTDHVMRLSLA